MKINANEFELLNLRNPLIQQRAMNAVKLCLDISECEDGIKYMKTPEIVALLGTGIDAKILKSVIEVKVANTYRRGGGSNGYGVNKEELDKLIGVLTRYREKMNAVRKTMNKEIPVAASEDTMFDGNDEAQN